MHRCAVKLYSKLKLEIVYMHFPPFVKGKMKKIFLSIEEMEMAGANQ